MEFKSLLSRAKDGTLTSEELRHAARAIETQDTSGGDLYNALHIVGLAGNPSMVELVIPYLDITHDPMLARLALQILCQYWGLTNTYIDRIRRFMLGVDWDEENDVKQIAIFIAGQYLREGNATGDLAEILLRIANDPTDDILRVDATRAIAVAMGDSPSSIPHSAAGTSIDSQWFRNVMARARATFGTD